ncbi:uncharacterized protein LOC124255076 [Haliotis rubra]|uniref:uncharacterized protein LOC124255076 n=1 Tax=Haliotis rubra TaxID=36100 RepID=UPI001EE62DB0|nr:uncharacterized protein LOC124255076 [Haliotis rubra]
MTQTLLLMLSLAAMAWTQEQFTPLCQRPFQWIRDRNDCARYWRCVWGRPVEMPRCHPGTILSARLNVCVFIGGIWDDCGRGTPTGTVAPPPLTVEDRCARGETVFPHPDHCQLYYNCSQTYEHVPRYFKQYLRECTYPQLFDVRSSRCQDFQEVDCGTREETINACDYRQNWCPVSHCIPCAVNLPPCHGRPDGRNPFPGREWSPWYVECLKGRTITTAQCTRDINFRVPQFFSLETNKCINLFRIPRERGGLMPSCDGLFDGTYPVEEKIPGVSFICSGGRLLNLRYCPDGSSQRPEPRTCVYS